LRERPERLAALKAGRFRRLVDQETGALTVDPGSTSHRQPEFVEEATGTASSATSTVADQISDLQTWPLDSGDAPKVVLD